MHRIRDGVANLIEKDEKTLKQNMSNKEFNVLQKSVVHKNEVHVINDTDKNLGAAVADKKMSLSNAKDNCLT